MLPKSSRPEYTVIHDKLEYPLVVCVGPIRSGTTWIYELLKSHPQCIVTDPKETSFFCINYDRGIDWFISKFQKPDEQTRLCADLSPTYFIYHEEMRRIRRHSDDVKLVICLRNPYDRLLSIHHKQNATQGTRAVLDYIHDEKLRRQDALGYNIVCDKAQFFFREFGRENVYFFYFDELISNPRSAAIKLLDFLGLDHHLPASVQEVVNPAYEPRSRLLQFLVRRISILLRWLKLHALVDRVKFSVGKRLLYGRNPSRPSLDERDLEKVLDHFRPEFNSDIADLENLTGLDLSHWKRR